ncbi:MAG: hypothetical protein R6V29_11920 [Spirochaetia bacterium]
MLLEGRARLGYTLSWMKHLTFPAATNGRTETVTGTQFRERYLAPHEENDAVRLGRRVFSVDLAGSAEGAAGTLDVITADKRHEQLQFNHLILAQGAVQVLFGRYLLPGKRTNRMFTSYQAGEMMEHYPFLPGNELVFFGESPYTIEAARAANEIGIASAIVSPTSFSQRYREYLPDVALYEDAGLTALTGDAVFTGIDIEHGGSSKHVAGDAIVVDGDFVLERQWRDMLGVSWDLEAGKTTVPETHPARKHFTLVGDALEPSPDFAAQYRAARTAVRDIPARVGVELRR